MNDQVLTVFVVYCDPLDYPNRFVVRAHVVTRAPGGAHVVVDPTPLAVTDDVDSARDAIPWGLFRMPRSPDDEPQILETWI